MSGAVGAGQRVGKYELVRELGRGGMSVVWAARDTVLGRDVALKLIADGQGNDKRRKRLLREARSLALLDHPGIAKVHDFGDDDGTVFLAMERIDGEPLSDVLAARGALPTGEVERIARALADALAAAHAQGVIHRDIKPSNIIVTPDGNPVLVDFGIARIEQAVSSELTATGDGDILGTPAYMSPEQARGLPVEASTDVFSFGCVVYEMLTGNRPFAGDTAADTVMALLSEQPEPLDRDVPAALRATVDRCLEKEPKERPTAAADVVNMLDSAPPRAGIPWLPIAAVASLMLALGAWYVIERPTSPSSEAAPLQPATPRVDSDAAAKTIEGIPSHVRDIHFIAASPSGAIVETQGRATTLYSSGRRPRELAAAQGARALRFLSQQQLAFATWTGDAFAIKKYDLASDSATDWWTASAPADAEIVRLSPDGEMLAVSTEVLTLFTRAGRADELRRLSRDHTISNFAFSPDNRWLAWSEHKVAPVKDGGYRADIYMSNLDDELVTVEKGIRIRTNGQLFLGFADAHTIAFESPVEAKAVGPWRVHTRTFDDRGELGPVVVAGEVQTSQTIMNEQLATGQWLATEVATTPGIAVTELRDDGVGEFISPPSLATVGNGPPRWYDGALRVVLSDPYRVEVLKPTGELVPSDPVDGNRVPIWVGEQETYFLRRTDDTGMLTLSRRTRADERDIWSGSFLHAASIRCSAIGCIILDIDNGRGLTTVRWLSGPRAGKTIATISTPRLNHIKDGALSDDGATLVLPQNEDGALLMDTTTGAVRTVRVRARRYLQHAAYDRARDRFIVTGLDTALDTESTLFTLSRNGTLAVLGTVPHFAVWPDVSPDGKRLAVKWLKHETRSLVLRLGAN